MDTLVIDAKDLILGRLASYAAKQALLGKKIVVVNSELAAVSGRKYTILERYKHLVETMGQPFEGPFILRRPDMFVRRTIRGMLPHKNDRGMVAYRHVMCYIGVPNEFAASPKVTVEGANVSKLPNLYYMTIAELCNEIGGYHG